MGGGEGEICETVTSTRNAADEAKWWLGSNVPAAPRLLPSGHRTSAASPGATAVLLTHATDSCINVPGAGGEGRERVAADGGPEERRHDCKHNIHLGALGGRSALTLPHLSEERRQEGDTCR